jgi:hypothetical protein
MRFIACLAAIVLTTVSIAGARAEGGGCCPQCGCNNVTAVCRLVPVVTKVPKVEYSCKCGDVCVPGHSKCVGTECVTDCDGHTHHQKVYEPSCAKIFKTVTPQKTTTMVEKCTYKCVVEYVCGKCGCGCSGNANGYASPQVPAMPKAAAPNDQANFPYWAP